MVGKTFLEVGDVLPALALRDLDGQAVDLARWRGKRVLLFMWASW